MRDMKIEIEMNMKIKEMVMIAYARFQSILQTTTRIRVESELQNQEDQRIKGSKDRKNQIPVSDRLKSYHLLYNSEVTKSH